MPNKVCIELRPFDATTILCFLREYINERNNQIPELAALHECVDAYEKQIYEKLSNEMIEETWNTLLMMQQEGNPKESNHEIYKKSTPR